MTQEQSAKPHASANPVLSSWLARALRQFPFMADGMRVLIGLIQARYTAGVVGVIFNEAGEMLIVEHVFHPRNAWGLPGGWMGARESPSAALARELREELELEVEIVCPLIIDNAYYSKAHLDIAFLCHAKSGIGVLSNELFSYQWISLDGLPRLMPFHNRAIQAARAHLER